MDHSYAADLVGEIRIYFAPASRSGTKRPGRDWHSGVETMPGENRQSGEGPMPVQWTAHIPLALQRHGGSIKPEAEAEGGEAMTTFLKALRQHETPPRPDNRADAAQH